MPGFTGGDGAGTYTKVVPKKKESEFDPFVKQDIAPVVEETPELDVLGMAMSLTEEREVSEPA